MTSFRSLDKLIARQDGGETIDEKVDGAVLASLETALSLLPVADGAVLAAGSRAAKRVHDGLGGDGDAARATREYLAGRLASVADLLGLAARRCAPPAFGEVLGAAKYADLLRLLAGTSMRNVDIANRIGSDVASVCRKLKELRAIGAVVSSQTGRDVVNSLTPAAEAFVETALLSRFAQRSGPFDAFRSTSSGSEERPPVISAAPDMSECLADS